MKNIFLTGDLLMPGGKTFMYVQIGLILYPILFYQIKTACYEK